MQLGSISTPDYTTTLMHKPGKERIWKHHSQQKREIIVHSKKQGFEVTVTVKDGLPHLQVSFASGESILDTDRLSIQGMENMAVVFEHAARLAYKELDNYWRAEHAKHAKHKRAAAAAGHS